MSQRLSAFVCVCSHLVTPLCCAPPLRATELGVYYSELKNANAKRRFFFERKGPERKHCLAIPCSPERIQTPLIPKIHPEIHPESSPETKIRKYYEKKHTKSPNFRIFFVIFSNFGFGRGFGVYFGVYFGDQRGFVFCTGRKGSQALPSLDDRQITHLICVCLRHLLYDFLRGCFGPPSFCCCFSYQRPKTPPKNHTANALGGDRSDE